MNTNYDDLTSCSQLRIGILILITVSVWMLAFRGTYKEDKYTVTITPYFFLGFPFRLSDKIRDRPADVYKIFKFYRNQINDSLCYQFLCSSF
jgi:hypothetical protein